MDKETKSNIKIVVIGLIVAVLVFGGLYKYNQAHEASAEHGHSHD
jgi:hypothetical protein